MRYDHDLYEDFHTHTFVLDHSDGDTVTLICDQCGELRTSYVDEYDDTYEDLEFGDEDYPYTSRK